MTFLPKNELGPNDPKKAGGRKPPTPTRILLWVLATCVGVYMVVAGLIGALAK